MPFYKHNNHKKGKRGHEGIIFFVESLNYGGFYKFVLLFSCLHADSKNKFVTLASLTFLWLGTVSELPMLSICETTVRFVFTKSCLIFKWLLHLTCGHSAL